MGVEAAVAARPDQVMAWPGTTEDGCESVFVVVTHRKKRGARNLSWPRFRWAAVVELEDSWSEWWDGHGHPFGVFFGVEGLDAEGDDGEEAPVLLIHDAELVTLNDEPAAVVWFNVNAEPQWVGRCLTASSVDRGEPDEDGIYDPPVEVEERVGVIVGRIRKVAVDAGDGEPWATVFELAPDEALVLGDQLQALGRSADGEVITHAALRQGLGHDLMRALGFAEAGADLMRAMWIDRGGE